MESVNTTTPQPGAVVPSADQRIAATASQIATAAAAAQQAAWSHQADMAAVIKAALEGNTP